MLKYILTPPPEIRGFLSYVLIPISKKYFQENPIFLQIKKKLLIESSEVIVD